MLQEYGLQERMISYYRNRLHICMSFINIWPGRSQGIQCYRVNCVQGNALSNRIYCKHNLMLYIVVYVNEKRETEDNKKLYTHYPCARWVFCLTTQSPKYHYIKNITIKELFLLFKISITRCTCIKLQ